MRGRRHRVGLRSGRRQSPVPRELHGRVAVALPTVDLQATGRAGARPLPPGARAELDIPCEGAIYVGPFEPHTEGETIALTAEHVETEQTCPGASWVDADDAIVTVAGLGCSDSGMPARMDLSYRYAPAAGEAGATPVYLKLTRGDIGPASCRPIHVVLVRTQ